MHYDPIKEYLGRFFNRHPLLRTLFYRLLNILLLRSWHVRRTLRRLAPSLPPAAQVLDAGMGFGQYSWWMARHYPHWMITAADIKRDQVDECNAFFAATALSDRVSAVEADLVSWSSDTLFDLIVCVDVMEHIAEDRTVLERFRAMTAAGGRLVISTPSDMGGSDVHSGDDTSFIGEHVRNGYSVEEITEKLMSAGYDHVAATYTYGPPGSLAWRLSMKYPVIMLSASRLFLILLPFYYLAVMPLALLLNYADLRMKHKKGTGLLVVAETRG